MFFVDADEFPHRQSHLLFHILMFPFLAFSTNFLSYLVTLIQVLENSPKWSIFGIFNELLSTQNVDVARFARNDEFRYFLAFLINFCPPQM